MLNKLRKGQAVIEYTVIGIFVIVILGCIIGPCCYNFSRRHISGNQKVFDTKWYYKYADVYVGGEKITIEIDSWNDYEGEQIQIVSKDGTSYIVSSFNTILRSK